MQSLLIRYQKLFNSNKLVYRSSLFQKIYPPTTYELSHPFSSSTKKYPKPLNTKKKGTTI